MSNKPIVDMIETIEHYAQKQPNFPVYNVLGEEHTYGQLKADSDSLAAHIDQIGLPEKSPVVVFGGQEYEMIATFVALTKSGHAYIPIDSHSALERVSAIVEVAEPSLIIAINEFPIETQLLQSCPWSKCVKLMRLNMPMICNIRSKGMITTTSSLPQGQLGNQKGCKFRTITCSALPTG